MSTTETHYTTSTNISSASRLRAYRWPNYLLPSVTFRRFRDPPPPPENTASSPQPEPVSLTAPSIPPPSSNEDSTHPQPIATPEEESQSVDYVEDLDEGNDSDSSASFNSANTSLLPLPSSSSTTTAAASPIPSSSSETPSEPTPTGPTQQNQNTYLKGSTSVLKCRKCQSDICFSEHIVSKGFNGRHGRAYLVHALPTFTHTLGKPSTRQLATGAHIVADISCSICLVTLGWKYISASDPEQQYKVGKFILETTRIIRTSYWHAGEGHETSRPMKLPMGHMAKNVVSLVPVFKRVESRPSSSGSGSGSSSSGKGTKSTANNSTEEGNSAGDKKKKKKKKKTKDQDKKKSKGKNKKDKNNTNTLEVEEEAEEEEEEEEEDTSLAYPLDIDTGIREHRAAVDLGDVNLSDSDELEDMFLGKWTPMTASRRRRANQLAEERRLREEKRGRERERERVRIVEQEMERCVREQQVDASGLGVGGGSGGGGGGGGISNNTEGNSYFSSSVSSTQPSTLGIGLLSRSGALGR